MRAQLRWFWSRLDANYWFYPALFVLLGLFLALIGTWLDQRGYGQDLAKDLPPLAATPDSAQTMLSVIASGMIGVAATVFSITIAAVAYASGNYGPRLLTNFLEDKGNQLSLATLIGTFVYSLTVLSSVRGSHEQSVTDVAEQAGTGFVPQISLLGAYLLTALCVAVIVFLLNHIPSSIRINGVLRDIGHRLLQDIRGNYDECDDPPEAEPAPPGQQLRACGTGYVQMIDFEDLAQFAKEQDIRIALNVRTGDFIHPGIVMAFAIGEPEGDEDLARRIEESISLGADRTPTQDPQFLLDELVEIGLRALSPGINDPFTAVAALHWIGAATSELGQRDLRKHEGTCDGERRVYPLPDPFDHYLTRGFGAIRSAVATSPIAARVMLETLGNAAQSISSRRRCELLQAQADMLLDQAQLALEGPDWESVRERHASLSEHFGS